MSQVKNSQYQQLIIIIIKLTFDGKTTSKRKFKREKFN